MIIWEPRWHDRVVLLAKHKVHGGTNVIQFTKGSLKGKVYTMGGEDITQCPLESNGKIPCYAVPLDSLILQENK